MPPGHTYILGSDTGILYIGVTELRARILDHKRGLREGFARDHNCNRLLYAQPFHTITEAIAREKQLKGWRRAKKLALIRQHNPDFRDLAADWDKPRLGPAQSLKDQP
jgi:putative endonuclease